MLLQERGGRIGTSPPPPRTLTQNPTPPTPSSLLHFWTHGYSLQPTSLHDYSLFSAFACLLPYVVPGGQPLPPILNLTLPPPPAGRS